MVAISILILHNELLNYWSNIDIINIFNAHIWSRRQEGLLSVTWSFTDHFPFFSSPLPSTNGNATWCRETRSQPLQHATIWEATQTSTSAAPFASASWYNRPECSLLKHSRYFWLSLGENSKSFIGSTWLHCLGACSPFHLYLLLFSSSSPTVNIAFHFLDYSFRDVHSFINSNSMCHFQFLFSKKFIMI